MGNTNQKNYENARQNSVGNNKKVEYVKYVKIPLAHIERAAIAVLLSAAIIAGGHVLVTKGLDDFQTNSITYEQTKLGRELVYTNTHRTTDKQYYYYDTFDIAQELVKDPKNFDRNLYGVYSAIGYNQKSKFIQMEEVVSDFGNIVKNNPNSEIKYYKDFTDYCTQKGFVKEDGTVDLNAYVKTIKEQIVKEEEMKKMQEEISEFKRR